MKILLTGAHGFIGSRLVDALREDDHQLVCLVRTPRPRDLNVPRARYVPADFSRLTRVEDWAPLLSGVDAVINTVGIFRESGSASFANVHDKAAKALFAAARQYGAQVIQFSALGADAEAASGFHISKRAADDALRAAGAPAYIVQPSLVYGVGGTSAALFNQLAVMPVVALPAGGWQRVQPVHINDVVAGVRAMLAQPAPGAVTVAFCGPEPVTVRTYLSMLRSGLGMAGRQWIIPVPSRMASAAARAGSWMPGSLVDADSLAMLNRGNTGNPIAFAALLGRSPVAPPSFIAPHEQAPLRADSILRTMLPVMRLCIAAVWLWTAAVSMGLYPIQDSLALLADAGVPHALAPIMLAGAAGLDLVLGVLTLTNLGGRKRWVWLAQMALILGYTAIITVQLPEQWLHPFGPISKNVPMLAALALLYLCDSRARRP
ncbi:MAG: SDR family oxidoreductase [Achromobacter sp.]|uniref:SDR family oxidoreductase n=1 Tax=Achromobacter sp. TaxID=134375 RepID=UPI0029A79655|nr:SDR family oxidoreductase [Achromobacter sp.]MDX3988345.1 SDR family oxidoreductase [Achromobacter sp.]